MSGNGRAEHHFSLFQKCFHLENFTLEKKKGKFTSDLMAHRIYGIFAFRWKYLKEFACHPETRLEVLESCDSNRTLDMSFRQYIAPYPSAESFSVDSPEDIGLVEKHMVSDEFWKIYK